jgi:predicted phosphodiesterase
MRLLAISDLHLSYDENRRALGEMPHWPDDWLIIAGDVGDGVDHLQRCLEVVVPRFARVIWTPGNHDLWTRPHRRNETCGVARYQEMVALARNLGVSTPEDPFPVFPHSSGPVVVAPLFVLYDYSFRPNEVPLEAVVEWAAAAENVCADEVLLQPAPFASRAAWCEERCLVSERLLASRPGHLPTVLVSHFPLHRSLAVLPRAPRFTPWCGTTRTADWHVRFAARAVVYGHLHIPGTRWIDGVPHQEVSFGYPSQRRRGSSRIGDYLREVQLAPASSIAGASSSAGAQ